MPNWVINKVKFSNKGKEILDKIIVVNDDKEELDENDVRFDFNKILPMPTSLNVASGGYDNMAIQYTLLKMSFSQFEKTIRKLKETKANFYGDYFSKIYRNKKYTLEELESVAEKFEQQLKDNKKDLFDEVDYEDLGIKNLEELGNVYLNNIINYGTDSWYDWCVNNWGTKWNAYRTYRNSDDEVGFETAWSCPFEVLKELSKQYKDVEIDVQYADEDIGSNCGEFVLLNGEIKEEIDIQNTTDFALDVWGYDKEEYYQERNEE